MFAGVQVVGRIALGEAVVGVLPFVWRQERFLRRGQHLSRRLVRYVRTHKPVGGHRVRFQLIWIGFRMRFWKPASFRRFLRRFSSVLADVLACVHLVCGIVAVMIEEIFVGPVLPVAGL